jgi:hypothetical protein
MSDERSLYESALEVSDIAHDVLLRLYRAEERGKAVDPEQLAKAEAEFSRANRAAIDAKWVMYRAEEAEREQQRRRYAR